MGGKVSSANYKNTLSEIKRRVGVGLTAYIPGMSAADKMLSAKDYAQKMSEMVKQGKVPPEAFNKANSEMIRQTHAANEAVRMAPAAVKTGSVLSKVVPGAIGMGAVLGAGALGAAAIWKQHKALSKEQDELNEARVREINLEAKLNQRKRKKL